MSESNGAGVTFRTLQAISDLRKVARLARKETRERIVAGLDRPSAEALFGTLIEEDGCRIVRPQTGDLHQALVLAAALPNDDFDAFQTATAVLLADRLQGGMGEDDLFWHWDAFNEHYRIALPHIRSALMNGFDRMEADGLVSLEQPPRPEDLVTESRDAIETVLAPERGTCVGVFRAALDAEEPGEEFWERHCLPNLGPEAPAPFFRAIRHIFETRRGWMPFGDARFDPADEGLVVIPVVHP